MGGKGETVRYTRLRAPKDAKANSMSYKELKKEVCDLIDSAAEAGAKITIIALEETTED